MTIWFKVHPESMRASYTVGGSVGSRYLISQVFGIFLFFPLVLSDQSNYKTVGRLKKEEDEQQSTGDAWVPMFRFHILTDSILSIFNDVQTSANTSNALVTLFHH